MSDDIQNPLLGEHIRLTLLNEFDGIQNPRMGLLQDNLAASADEKTGEITGRPIPNILGAPLFASQSETFIMFEALQGWNCPFANPDMTANAVPADGIEFGFTTYGATYIQLYVCDIDDPDFWPAFELWATILAGSIPGDIDGDGVVDVTDLLVLLAAWGPCPKPCPPSCAADINDDCIVNVTDLLTLLANWG